MPNSRTRTARRHGSGGRASDRHAPAPASGRPRSPAIFIVTGALAALVLLGGVVFFTARGGNDTGGTEAAGAQVAHVHGLGVDPQDGMLYAGTHYGLFRVPEQGGASQVADRVQDFMGFTVAGPNHYLASGHPGQGQDGPSSLGLIESTDGGQTWNSLSLAGEADFHALEARHDRVYGLNSLTGALMVSEDKQSWQARSRIPMADFAVSAEDPDVLVATTEQGLVRTRDGGRSFQPVPGAPTLLLVSWAEDGTVVGVGPDGTVHASTDDGQNWEQRGRLDTAPHALTAAGGGDVYVAVDGAILTSDDGGRSFTVRYREGG
jgi:photosystem II stability/assembly factor-like uncharacterized protein